MSRRATTTPPISSSFDDDGLSTFAAAGRLAGVAVSRGVETRALAAYHSTQCRRLMPQARRRRPRLLTVARHLTPSRPHRNWARQNSVVAMPRAADE